MYSPLVSLLPTKKFAVFDVISLREAAISVLTTEDILTQADLTFIFVEAWESGKMKEIISINYGRKIREVPSKPGRLLPQAGSLPKTAKNAVLTAIHGIAHAESYAMELFWDCIARYTDSSLPMSFYDDMVHIAGQEARHFLDWYNRLGELGCPYGSLWTHDGLWRSAEQTFHSLTDRIAVINLLHEARGLDTFPLTLQKFKSSGDDTSVAILKRNYEEEVHHVATGVKWFRYIYERDHNNNETSSKKESGCVQNFQEIVRKYHSGAIKGPFNTDARNRAGLTEEWYMPLTVV